ncbi:MAG TPA: carbon storage regulator [Planctomycetaceae bacterium]|nr:carbon storage regulator [Planctomycetaceae bacterium]
MLVISRKKGETIFIGNEIEVKVIRVRGGRVQIGIDCPKSISVDRYELLQQKRASPSKLHERVFELQLRDTKAGHELHVNAEPLCPAAH